MHYYLFVQARPYVFSCGRGIMPTVTADSDKSSRTTGHHQNTPQTELKPQTMIAYHAANEALAHSVHQPPVQLPLRDACETPPEAPPLAPPIKRPRPFDWPS